MKISKKWGAGLSLLALAVGAQAQTNPFAKGPNPTEASLRADGPFAVTTQTVRGQGFGGATIYSPNTPGAYALVVFCPGFTARQNSIAVLGRRLATQGFVVATIDTNSTFDQPPSRATQMLAALRTIAAVNTGPAAGKIDTSRQALTGHSMGGGGTLIASRSTPTLKAGVALAPFSTDANFGAIVVPTAIIAAQNDRIAPNNQHSTPFFNSIPAGVPKLLCIIGGAGHLFVQDSPANQPGSKLQIAWFKRFADNDTRYTPFLRTPDPGCSTFRVSGAI